MKQKRHFFDLFSSVFNTFLSVTVFTVCLIAIGNGITPLVNMLFVVCMMLVTVTWGCICVAVNGFAAWQVIDGRLIIMKLFRKKRSILLDEITSIQECKINFIDFDLTELEGYAISGSGITLKIPIDKASDALVEEVKRKNGI